MSIINALVRLLSFAYKAEADKLRKHAAKLDKAQAKVSLAAVDAARQADILRDEAIELGQEKAHTNDRADGLLARRAEVIKFFQGE